MNEEGIFRTKIPEEQSPERVDRVVARLLPEVARAEIQRWIANGRVLLDGKTCRSRDKARPGNQLEVRPDQPAATSAEPDPSVEIHVLFEDKHLLVVNKAPGVVVHPGRGHPTGTLVNGLLARPGFERLPDDPLDTQSYLRPGIVHRIDKDTSGILVVAKDPRTREGLKEQLAEHTVKRVYQALTVGQPKSGSINTLHARDPHSRLRFSSKVNRGKRAITHLAVVETLAGGRAALVECRLQTGRTHQIRVHLSQEASTPILADDLYGGNRGDSSVREIGQKLGRQALHAGLLGFVHPITGETVSFELPLPTDMQEALDSLRRI